MRVLTTAINQGEHKVPEGHRCTRYALVPGEAMVIGPWRDGFERSVTKITPEMAKHAKYTYCLSWLDGRTVAEFDLDGKVVAQPTQDDPKERRKRGDKTGAIREDGEGRDDEDQGTPLQHRGRVGRAAARSGTPEGAGDDRPGADAQSRRRARLPAPAPEATPEPRRRPRKEKAPLGWL